MNKSKRITSRLTQMDLAYGIWHIAYVAVTESQNKCIFCLEDKKKWPYFHVSKANCVCVNACTFVCVCVLPVCACVCAIGRVHTRARMWVNTEREGAQKACGPVSSLAMRQLGQAVVTAAQLWRPIQLLRTELRVIHRPPTERAPRPDSQCKQDAVHHGTNNTKKTQKNRISKLYGMPEIIISHNT